MIKVITNDWKSDLSIYGNPDDSSTGKEIKQKASFVYFIVFSVIENFFLSFDIVKMKFHYTCPTLLLNSLNYGLWTCEHTICAFNVSQPL